MIILLGHIRGSRQETHGHHCDVTGAVKRVMQHADDVKGEILVHPKHQVRILRESHHRMRLWNCLDVKWLWRVIQSSGHEYDDAGHDETIHDAVT